MIHDDLTRLFERTPQPSLSPEFSMNLRRRLRQDTDPRPSSHAGWRRWAPLLYWVTAAAGLAVYWRPAALTPLQMATLTLVGAAMLLTLRRAARPGPLTRVLRQLWR